MSKREQPPTDENIQPGVFFQGYDYQSQYCSIPLQCPSCQAYNLHHTTIEIQNRTSEDEGGMKITVGAGVSVVNATGKEFLHRRDNILITFSCEDCCDYSDKIPWRLCIYQHKGQTLMKWTK